MNNCPSCGTPLPPGVLFCTNCGAKVNAPAVSPSSVPQAPEKKSGGCGKIVLIIFIIVLLIFAGFAGLSYWGFKKVKQKVTQKWEQAKTEIEKSEKSGGSSSATTEKEVTELACPHSDLSLLSLEKGTIPMRVGLTMAKSWTTQKGDVETLTQVQSINNDAVVVTTSAPDTASNDPTAKLHGMRNICVTDLKDGAIYVTGWGTNLAETIRGATMFSLSRSEFDALKNNGEIPFTYYDSVTRTGHGTYRIGRNQPGKMTREEPDDVPFSIIVNDSRVELPTIHAAGMLGGNRYELNVLDDANNPIVVNFQQPSGRFGLKILKISYPEEKKIEKQLAEEGKALIYGIYFDFNSANIREESEPVLKEIADALNAHPDWSLSVNGHTDSVGGATYNIGLSQRRAEAVKKALVERYAIAADRLSTVGFGMSQPIETNDTPEGRARNRRVELIKR